MKKFLSLVLVTILVLGLSAFTVSAAEGENNTSVALQPAIDDNGTELPEDGFAVLGKDYRLSYRLNAELEGIKDFDGSSSESTSVGLNYMPKGVNGVELIRYNIRYNMTTKTYDLLISTIPNPTVEVFEDLVIKVKFNKQVNGSTYSSTVEVPITSLGNERHQYSDVLTAASGYKFIQATKNVIDSNVFDQNYGQELHIDYNDYNVIFPKVAEQNTSLNLKADYSYATAGSAKENDPIVKLVFENIIVKDAATIQIRFRADQQNYNGSDVWVYDLVNGKPVGDGYQAQLSKDGSVLVTVPANTKLSSLGVYADKQDTTNNNPQSSKPSTSGTSSSITGSGSGSNPQTGASDVVSIVSAFAVVSLAAAAFVATKKVVK